VRADVEHNVSVHCLADDYKVIADLATWSFVRERDDPRAASQLERNVERLFVGARVHNGVVHPEHDE
jgi:hypothetical protein